MKKTVHKYIVLTVCIFSILALAPIGIEAQSLMPKLGTASEDENNDTDTVGAIEKNFRFTPYIAPSYSPEVDVLLSAGGLISFRLDKFNELLERSSIPFSVGYSSNGSTAITAFPYFYGKGGKYKIEGSIYYKHMPDNYWGIGYDAGMRTSEPNSSTAYQREWWSLSGQFVYKLYANIFGGIMFDFNHTQASDLNDYMIDSDENIQEYGTDVRNMGIGLSFERDTRDNSQNAYSGSLVNVGFLNYSLLGRNKFNKINLDVRKYFQIKDKRQTIAMQYSYKQAFGDVPWTDMSQAGTPMDLRGYQWGRFRDKVASFGLVEYRHMFGDPPVQNGKISLRGRFGFVTWLGVGNIDDNFIDWDDWLPNVGAGLRIEIQPRMNLRLDYGFGRDSHAAYVTFREAF